MNKIETFHFMEKIKAYYQNFIIEDYVVNEWADKLKPSGMLFLEIGNGQGDGIKSVLTSFCDIRVVKDIYKNDRIVIAKPLDRNL